MNLQPCDAEPVQASPKDELRVYVDPSLAARLVPILQLPFQNPGLTTIEIHPEPDSGIIVIGCSR